MADDTKTNDARPDVSGLETGPGYAKGEMLYSDEAAAKEQKGHLPTGMAEKVETVEISTLTPKE